MVVKRSQQEPFASTNPLEAQHLTKSYVGGPVAVSDVSLAISPGSTLCMLGPNGAGKTTTIKMCSTLLAPDSGQLRVAGVDAISHPREARRRIGLALGGDRGFYSRASVKENLLFFADIAGVSGGDRRRQVTAALEAVSLGDRALSRVQELSRGMKQRLHLARALLGRPSLLLLDEPTNGLDPEIAVDIRGLIKKVASEGTGILLTTHYMGEAEALADSLIILQGGHVRYRGAVADVAQEMSFPRVLTFTAPFVDEQLADLLSGLPDVGRLRVETRGDKVAVLLPWKSVDPTDETSRLLKQSFGSVPVDLVSRLASLEESYLTLIATPSKGEPAA